MEVAEINNRQYFQRQQDTSASFVFHNNSYLCLVGLLLNCLFLTKESNKNSSI